MDGLWADGMEAATKLTAVSYVGFVRTRTKARQPIPLSFFLCLVLSQAIDTGTSLIYVPSTIASAFYSLIPGSKRASQYGSGKPSPLLCHVLKETKTIPIYMQVFGPCRASLLSKSSSHLTSIASRSTREIFT
jgi:hypothetical protein